MFRRFCLVSLCSVIAWVALLATAIPVLPQSTPTFQYVIPRFSSNAGSQLILSNLSGVLASPEVAFRDTAHGIGVGAIISVAAGTQQRLTAASFWAELIRGQRYRDEHRTAVGNLEVGRCWWLRDDRSCDSIEYDDCSFLPGNDRPHAGDDVQP